MRTLRIQVQIPVWNGLPMDFAFMVLWSSWKQQGRDHASQPLLAAEVSVSKDPCLPTLGQVIPGSWLSVNICRVPLVSLAQEHWQSLAWKDAEMNDKHPRTGEGSGSNWIIQEAGSLPCALNTLTWLKQQAHGVARQYSPQTSEVIWDILTLLKVWRNFTVLFTVVIVAPVLCTLGRRREFFHGGSGRLHVCWWIHADWDSGGTVCGYLGWGVEVWKRLRSRKKKKSLINLWSLRNKS